MPQNWIAVPTSLDFLFILGQPNLNNRFFDIILPELALKPDFIEYQSLYVVVSTDNTRLTVQGQDIINNKIEYLGSSTHHNEAIFDIGNMQTGTYDYAVIFTLYGVLSEHEHVEASTFIIPVSVIISSSNIPQQLEPWHISFNEGNYANDTYTINMFGPFELKLYEIIEVQTLPVGVTHQLLNGYNIYTGDDDVVLTLNLKPILANVLAPDTYNYTGYTKQQNNAVQQILSIEVIVYEIIDWDINPTALSFSAIQFVEEATPQNIQINTIFNFIIQSVPTWVTLNQTQLTTNIFKIVVTPALATATPIGVLNGNIVIVYNNNGTDVVVTIPVQYTVVGLVDVPYNIDDFAFTLDVNFVNFYSELSDTFFSVKMLAKIYDITGNFKTRELFYKIPIFQNRQAKNYGRIIDRLMFELNEYQPSVTYKPTEVSFDIQRIKRATNELVDNISIPNIKFVAGITPMEKSGKMYLLTINPSYSQATTTSFHFFNFLVAFGTYVYNIYRNGTLVLTENISTGLNNIFSKKVQFNNYTPGDIIKCELVDTDNNRIKKEYLIFPGGKYENQIVWVDEYKLLQTVSFTGEYYIDATINNTGNTVFKNLLSFYEKIDSYTEAHLYINTGFLAISDQVTIKGMLNRKKAWLLIGTEVINIVPISNKIRSIDSERDIIDFDIQFKINFKDNAQSYSF